MSTPLLAFAASGPTARRVVPLLGVLGTDVDVVSWRRCTVTDPDRVPDAVVASEPDLLHGLPEVPAAAWVDDEAGLASARRWGADVSLTANPILVDRGAVLVPRSGVEVRRWPAVRLAERAELRERHRLDERLVVVIGRSADLDDAATALAVAAAGVVTGPLLPVALALGTPVVTSPESARRLGVRPGREVEVAASPGDADRAARALTRDPDIAEARSTAGRRFAERHLDLGVPASVLRTRLGLTRTPCHDPMRCPR